MRIRSIASPADQLECAWLALGVFDDDCQDPGALETKEGGRLGAILRRLAESKDLTGSLGELVPIHGEIGFAAGSVLCVGLGKRAKFDAGAAHFVGVAVARRLSAKPRSRVAVRLPLCGEPLVIAQALAQGAVVGCKGPGLKKAEPARHSFEEFVIAVPADSEPKDDDDAAWANALERGRIIGEAINAARDLINLPPSEKSPVRLAARARELATGAGVEVSVWDEGRIRDERFGGLLGVAAGSDQPPAFVVLESRGAGPDAPTYALIGKGVTFDSGGLSLKPSSSMENMKADMTGAAVVLAAITAAARLRIPVNLTGYLALAENMTGGRAMKLGDVLTIRNGKTVEVLNTDAEGRLILADALSYAVERKPAAMVDLATLTGACMVALGLKTAGLFANRDDLADQVVAAAREVGERVWRMPLDDDFKDGLKSTVADCKNIGGKWGGAITAAKFLEGFVGDVPWAHLDIAGPSWADSESATQDAGATACFTRALIALAESWARSRSSSDAPAPTGDVMADEPE